MCESHNAQILKMSEVTLSLSLCIKYLIKFELNINLTITQQFASSLNRIILD